MLKVLLNKLTLANNQNTQMASTKPRSSEANLLQGWGPPLNAREMSTLGTQLLVLRMSSQHLPLHHDLMWVAVRVFGCGLVKLTCMMLTDCALYASE